MFDLYAGRGHHRGVPVTDRTKLGEATGRALFNPVQFVSALFNGRVADGFLNRSTGGLWFWLKAQLQVVSPERITKRQILRACATR